MQKAVVVPGIEMPKSCFRCFASYWYEYGGPDAGFMCKALPLDSKILSNCEGRNGRRPDCPLSEVVIKEEENICEE